MIDKIFRVSDIKNCEDELQKFLSESPIQSTIEKVCRDITRRRDETMALEFAKVICGLLEENKVKVHCIQTKFGEEITENSMREEYGVIFDGMDFSEHDKEFIDEIEKLKCQLHHKENALTQIDRIISEIFGIAHNGDEYSEEFKELLRNQSALSDFLPTEPIEVASELINAWKTRQDYMGFSISELQQIAEHLLVYCNANESEGEE